MPKWCSKCGQQRGHSDWHPNIIPGHCSAGGRHDWQDTPPTPGQPINQIDLPSTPNDPSKVDPEFFEDEIEALHAQLLSVHPDKKIQLDRTLQNYRDAVQAVPTGIPDFDDVLRTKQKEFKQALKNIGDGI
eukprot:NODE_9340_length_600_cov_10.291405_g8706_i0.p1 GENE.NODE_9340_length_600_cov_10.291405_g8706_i0~~NODE_9340_length_600_cov_10.291405_g8706_i0.p1  ORF type:complete len:142 (+),score=25.14 NODE_9340_length_600_cov_10.291405_g8706_i0:35-427(+)